MSQPTIESLVERFANSLADIYLMQHAAREIFTKEIKAVEAYERSLEALPAEAREVAMHIMSGTFPSAFTGELVRLPRREQSVQERLVACYGYKNQDYQWLFAHAYEHFETLVKSLYAVAGIASPSIWSAKHHKKLAGSDASYEERVAALRDASAHDVLSQLRTSLTLLREWEQKNPIGLDFVLVAATLAMLRHVIVHRGGRTEDKDRFVQRVLQTAGRPANAKNRAFVLESFYGAEQFENDIMFLEVPVVGAPLPIYRDRFQHMTGFLITHAQMIGWSLREELVRRRGTI